MEIFKEHQETMYHFGKHQEEIKEQTHLKITQKKFNIEQSSAM